MFSVLRKCCDCIGYLVARTARIKFVLQINVINCAADCNARAHTGKEARRFKQQLLQVCPDYFFLVSNYIGLLRSELKRVSF